ncbi:MAG: acetylxylan esterase [Candidatus Hydrogenedentes bacterium]|nr:acetylxylan esterase [Candidatus Hydrogenedentota bacterium]
MTRFTVSLLLALSAVSSPAFAAGADAFKELLGRPIIGPQQAFLEVQAWCAAHVVPMPVVDTAEAWEQEASGIRREVLERIVFAGAAKPWRDAPCRVEWLGEIPGGPGYRIKKLRYEALPGLWIPAVLYEPETLSGKVPVVLNPNGHDAAGKAADYKQTRCINLAKRGMLVLNQEWLGMGQLNAPGYTHYRMNQLDLCGTSGLAPFFLNLSRGLDLLLAHPNADPERVAVTGLSGGGCQTIQFCALDTRVTLACPVAGYSSFVTRAMNLKDLGDSEQTPRDLAALADYTHLTAMMAPRPTLLIYNSKDNCCFESGYALQPLLDAAQPVFRLYGAEERLRWHVNDDPGTHNYLQDNREAFYAMLGDFFYGGSLPLGTGEIPCADELKSSGELLVDLPEDNENFNTLALKRCKDLPNAPQCPGDKDAAAQWQRERRAALAGIVRAQTFDLRAEKTGQETTSGIDAAYWKFSMDGAWTVPGVELTPPNFQGTVIIVADAGRADVSGQAARLLGRGMRVLAVDPFYFGESAVSEKAPLYALTLSAVGARPLGLQSSQIAAVARWAAGREPGQPVTLLALGERSSLCALVAAALEEEFLQGVEVHGSPGSLKEVIELNREFPDCPEFFCFGLLESFDIAQILELVTPRPVRMINPSERAKQEFAKAAETYRVFGKDFDPLEQTDSL